MGDILDRAMEHDGLLLNGVALVFSGSSTPEVDEPDAPLGSLYLRSNGERYTRTASTGSGVAEDWVREDPAATGGAGIVALSWRFSTSIVIADPGSKRIRFDNATPASVTKIAVDDITNGNFDASLILNELSNGDKLFIQESAISANFLFGTVTAVTDQTGWFEIDITVTSSGTLPGNNRDVAFFIIKAGGGGGGTPSDQPTVQARRTTNQAFTSAWVDVPLDATDEENDATVLEHSVTTDRLDLKENGMYEIHYRVDAHVAAQGNFHADVFGRVRANDVGADLPGSESESDVLDDSSLVGDQTISDILSATFDYEVTAAPEFISLQVQKLDTSGTGAINARANGTVLKATRKTGVTGPAGPAGADKIYRIGKTYAIGGEIKVPVGQTDLLVPFFISVAAGQTVKLVKARHQIQTGTSVTLDVEVNGVGATGFTGLSVTTTPTDTDPTDVNLSDNDELSIVVSAVAGTPQNMTFTLFLEITQ